MLDWYGCVWSNKVVTFKKIPTSVDIEVDEICQTKTKDMLIRKIRISCSEMNLNIGVVENFANFTGKYLCWSLFFNKVADLQLY